MSPKHYTHELHAHYLTFSCYKNLSLFNAEALLNLFIQSLDQAHNRGLFRLYGFVVMPNHVHLLVFPLEDMSISAILTAVKQPFSYRALNFLQQKDGQLYQHLRAKKGEKLVRRFWQTGGGYDRNIFKDEAFVKTLEYMHYNPVREGLVKSPEDWKWSSARFYETRKTNLINIDYPEWW